MKGPARALRDRRPGAAKRLTFAALLVLALSPAVISAQPETIVLGIAQGVGGAGRPAVLFTHQSHMTKDGLDCLSCHHRYESKGGTKENLLDLGSLVEGASGIACSSCHRGPAALRQAYHRLCIGCHDASARRSGGAAAPRTCGECHPRSK